MPAAGYVAMWLGIVFSLVVGCGLMMLVFYSSRHGHLQDIQRLRGWSAPPSEPFSWGSFVHTHGESLASFLGHTRYMDERSGHPK
jgi:hypothetical protein